MPEFFVEITFAGLVQAPTAQESLRAAKRDLGVKPYEERSHLSVWACGSRRKGAPEGLEEPEVAIRYGEEP